MKDNILFFSKPKNLQDLIINCLKKVCFWFLFRLKQLFNTFKILKLKFLGIQIDFSSKISNDLVSNLGFYQSNKGQIIIGSKSEIHQGVILDCWGGSITLNENIFIGPYTVIYGHGGVTIGKNTLISMHCRLISSNHTIPDREGLIRDRPDILLPIVIGEDVWLGAGVTILGGVKIGDGCVIGAGAVVTKDIPAYSVAVGVPANVVRER